MFDFFSSSRLIANCLDCLSVAICALFGCVLCGAATAAPGQLDSTFGAGGIVIDATAHSSAIGLAITLQSDGKILVAGGCTDGLVTKFCVSRYLPSGSLDIGFGLNGQVTTTMGNANAEAFSVVVQPDGKIVAAGLCSSGAYSFCLARYDVDGVLDPGFGVGGVTLSAPDGQTNYIKSVKLTSDGKIVAAGTCAPQQSGTIISEICLVRYLPNGMLDATFGNGGKARLGHDVSSSASALAVQPDDKLVVAGGCGGTNNFCVARLLTSGELDLTFGNSGLTVTSMSSSLQSASSIVMTPGGSAVLGGYCASGNALAFCFARYGADGVLDTNFGTNGKVVTLIGAGAIAQALALQSDGKLIAAGSCGATSATSDFCVARYNVDETPDLAFGSNGRVITPIGTGEDRGMAIALQPDGRFVVGGYCVVSGANNFCLARFDGGPYPTQNCALDIDANLVTEPATDALLLIRYLLGFRGAALTTGAIGANPTRTRQALENYLDSLNLDADGDGQAFAMTDGLLILRAMLGLTGTALTQGATNASHPNVRSAQQILSWVEATHGAACVP